MNRVKPSSAELGKYNYATIYEVVKTNFVYLFIKHTYFDRKGSISDKYLRGIPCYKWVE